MKVDVNKTSPDLTVRGYITPDHTVAIRCKFDEDRAIFIEKDGTVSEGDFEMADAEKLLYEHDVITVTL